MEVENFYAAGYRGSKQFKQLDVPTANATGFGAAADDYMERGIDLNEQLIRNKPATYFMRVTGNSMINAGIHDGDVVIVRWCSTSTNAPTLPVTPKCEK